MLIYQKLFPKILFPIFFFFLLADHCIQIVPYLLQWARNRYRWLWWTKYRFTFYESAVTITRNRIDCYNLHADKVNNDYSSHFTVTILLRGYLLSLACHRAIRVGHTIRIELPPLTIGSLFKCSTADSSLFRQERYLCIHSHISHPVVCRSVPVTKLFSSIDKRTPSRPSRNGS